MAKITNKQKEALCSDAIEVNKDGKKKYTQQNLAEKYGISKGMINRYVKQKVNISKQIVERESLLIGELYKIEEDKSKFLSKQEVIEVNKQVSDRVKSLQYYQSSARENQELSNDVLIALKNKKNKLTKQEDKDNLALECLPVLRDHANITKINKEVDLGKDPDTVLNLQNNNVQETKILTMNDLYD